MPTGYTAFIENGEIDNGKDFLKLCTRAFGIAMSLRDEPLSVPTPKRFEPDSYYTNRVREAIENLDRVMGLKHNEAIDEMITGRNDDIKYYEAAIKKQEAINDKYDSIRKEIIAWKPPTPEHVELKKFALNQIDISIERTSWYQECLDKLLATDLDTSYEAVDAYISERIKNAKEEVENANESLRKEIDRVEKRNEWISEFYKSIGE